MVLRRYIARLIALLVVAGLVLAPIANPAVAKSPSVAGMTDQAMPCCPDEDSSGCQDCPLAAICALKVTSIAPSFADAILIRPSSKTAHVAFSDVRSPGLNLPPLDHPPRNLA
jgi:hypothetical protein